MKELLLLVDFKNNFESVSLLQNFPLSYKEYRLFSGVSLCHSCKNLIKQELLEIMKYIYLDLRQCVSINVSTSVVTFNMGS